MSQISTVDTQGRVLLPKPMLEALGIASESEVVVELSDGSIVIKSKDYVPAITQRIANMKLPVSDWEHMEQEIDAGRLS
ncbi:MAG TPA: AbrB/MazE/SpoVT family DNA-binding domain-containing protein [Roseiflexaceae bacterium]|jgi:AbrB family looped-hinge helix DNA binding protein|nr:AbrB/MazE/SpoVT family DNA-binding domain-containing protein [Roseiflexaceae bacterium]